MHSRMDTYGDLCDIFASSLTIVNANNIVSCVLTHDITLMHKAWKKSEIMIDSAEYQIKAGMFSSVHALYTEIVRLIRSDILMDIMPIIDEYLEIYDLLCKINI